MVLVRHGQGRGERSASPLLVLVLVTTTLGAFLGSAETARLSSINNDKSIQQTSEEQTKQNLRKLQSLPTDSSLNESVATRSTVRDLLHKEIPAGEDPMLQHAVQAAEAEALEGCVILVTDWAVTRRDWLESVVFVRNKLLATMPDKVPSPHVKQGIDCSLEPVRSSIDDMNALGNVIRVQPEHHYADGKRFCEELVANLLQAHTLGEHQKCDKCDGEWHGPACMICPLNRADTLCQNGSVFNQKTCVCDNCKAPWRGKTCAACILDCKKGPFDADKCSCGPCERNWSGKECETCGLIKDVSCKNGGTLNEDTCLCECVAPWQGTETCDECPYKENECLNGSKLDNCECKNCKEPWSGTFCDKCQKDKVNCLGRGVVDVFFCQCKDCENNWKGNRCQTCGVNVEKCKNTSKFNKVNCMCEGCPAVWDGPFCDTCIIKPSDCKGRGIPNNECKCDCQGHWSGDLCETCLLSSSQCKHGAKLLSSSCECSIGCPDPWAGVLCDHCTLKEIPSLCTHGSTPNTDLCMCTCKPPWKGKFCDACGWNEHNCVHNKGQFDWTLCKCTHCEFPWGGPLCNTCQYKQADCKHEGTLQTAKGQCKCVKCLAPWFGPTCDVCPYESTDCVHGGTIDKDSCTCIECQDEYWGGPLCNVCQRTQKDCAHGTLKQATCTCQPCPHPWAGELCGACKFEQEDCQHDTLLSKEKCECQLCDERWTGLLCDTCNRNLDMCANAIEFDEKNCRCFPCKKPWVGDFCDKCIRNDGLCVHGGHINPAICRCVDCDEYWTGEFCNTCSILPTDCKQGKLNSPLCKCVCPAGEFFSGRMCENCDLKQADCMNGGELNVKECRCKKCLHPWDGHKCDKCVHRSQKNCANEGKFNSEICKCEECNEPWEGPECKDCSRKNRDCKHGSKLDRTSCTCLPCAKPWGGPLCGECVINLTDCVHRTAGVTEANLDSCGCKNCLHPWEGNLCNSCPLRASDCKNGSTFDRTSCRCINCPTPWIGEFCQTCTLKSCTNGGRVQNCKCVCPKPQWGSSQAKDMDCNRCLLGRNSCRFGEFNVAQCKCINCPDQRSGLACEGCPRTGGKECGGPGKGSCNKGRCRCSPGYGGHKCDAQMSSGTCSSGGDPHPRTAGGETYDWYQGGEWIMYQDDQTGERANVAIETARQNCGRNGCVAYNRGLAASYEGDKIAFYKGQLTYNCQRREQRSAFTTAHGIKYAPMGSSGAKFTFPVSGTVAVIRSTSVTVSIRAVKDGHLKGMCGRWKHGSSDDIPNFRMNRSGRPGDWAQPTAWMQQWAIEPAQTLYCNINISRRRMSSRMMMDFTEIAPTISFEEHNYPVCTMDVYATHPLRPVIEAECKKIIGPGAPQGELTMCFQDSCLDPTKIDYFAVLAKKRELADEEAKLSEEEADEQDQEDVVSEEQEDPSEQPTATAGNDETPTH